MSTNQDMGLHMFTFIAIHIHKDSILIRGFSSNGFKKIWDKPQFVLLSNEGTIHCLL